MYLGWAGLTLNKRGSAQPNSKLKKFRTGPEPTMTGLKPAHLT